MLNITTGLVIWCSQAATFAGVLYLAWRHQRSSPFYLAWSVGFLSSGTGFALSALRGQIPDIASIELANLLILLGPSFWMAGFCLMDERKVSWTILLPGAIWLAGILLPWIQGDLANRVMLFYLGNATAGALLIQAVDPLAGDGKSTRQQLAIVFAAVTVVSFGIAAAIALHHPSAEGAVRLLGFAAIGTAVLQIAAIALSVRLIMERSARRWHAISATDTLTGVLNRRGLQERFAKMTANAGGGTLAVLLFDLDHFKAINDRHGHQTGDVVLTEFARLAQQFVPASGTFGRMGGEEFLALVAVRDTVQAEALAETIRTNFGRVPLLANAALVSATVSIGIAVAPLTSADWDKAISAADRALYAAKGAGRNCTVIYGEHEAAAATDTPPDPKGGELVPNLDDQIHALKRIGTLARL